MMNPISTDSTRRDFVRLAGSGAAALALGFQLMGCDSTEAMDEEEPDPTAGSGIQINGNIITLDLRKNDTSALANAGGFLLIGSQKTVVINAAGTIRAFTSVCTHQGCDINKFENDRMVCPCHGSQFSTSGAVVTGPAAAALAEFGVVRNGDEVVITI